MTYVALLRGINVGGQNKGDMKHLKAALEGAGTDAVQTYINSGNVIFRANGFHRLELVSALERTIEATFGFQVPVFLRHADAFLALVEALPDCWVDGKEAKCDVLFLSDAVDNEEILTQLPIRPGIDDVRYVPGAVLWRVSRSLVTRSGLSVGLIMSRRSQGNHRLYPRALLRRIIRAAPRTADLSIPAYR